jgi:acylphosphatase
MSAKRLTIRGEVQAVGFRQWMVDQAQRLGVAGWVRNRADGTVEALVAGDTAAVEELLRACRRGPRLAHVASIEEELVGPDDADVMAGLGSGFQQLPSA